MREIIIKDICLKILTGLLIGGIFTFAKGTFVMLCAITFVGIVLWKILPKNDRIFLVNLYLIGIALRFILFAIFYLLSICHSGNGEIIPDSRLYFLRVLYMLRSLKGQPELLDTTDFSIGVGANGYNYVLLFFYNLIGYNPVIPNPVSIFSDKLINCLISVLTGIIIFYITKYIFGKTAAKIAGIFAVFSPNLVFWSMSNIREPANIFLISLILLLLHKIEKKQNTICCSALLLITLFLLKTIRPYIFNCMITVIGIIIFTAVYTTYFKKRIILTFILVGAILFFLIWPGALRPVHDKIFNLQALATNIYNANHAILSQKGSNYIIYDDDMLSNGRVNKFKLFKGLLRGSAFFLLVPLPWTISSLSQLFAGLQVISWYILIPFSIMGVLLAIRYSFKATAALILYVVITTFALATVEGNIGSAYRHRDLVLPFYLIFSAAGISYLLAKIKFNHCR